MTSFRYQFDPPVNDSIVSLRISDLDHLSDGDLITSWGIAIPVGNITYKNDSNFPHVKLISGGNSGFLNLGQQAIIPSEGFTYTGLVYTTSLLIYPLMWSYATGRDNGIRLYRTGTGDSVSFRSQKSGNIDSKSTSINTVNTWQVFTCRVKNNGDSTVTMELIIDNVLKSTVTAALSGMEGITNGLLEIGNSSAWTGQPTSPIHISDCYFYDRALSDTELQDMYTYLNTMGDIYIAPSLTLSPTPISITIDISAVEGATGYHLTFQSPTSLETTIETDFTYLQCVVMNLVPETQYTIRLYVNTGSGYVIDATETVETLSNSSTNYNKDIFGVSGVYNLKSLDNTARDSLLSVMNDVFATGDNLKIELNGKSKNVSFIRRGETANIPNSGSGVLIPFDPSGGSSQKIDITLSDTTSTSIDYNETTNTISVQSVVYTVGDSLVLDGKKVTISEY